MSRNFLWGMVGILGLSGILVACNKSAEAPVENPPAVDASASVAGPGEGQHNAHVALPGVPSGEVGGAVGAVGEAAAPVTRRVFFVGPQDGATLTNPIRVQFGVEGMGIRPAGEDASDRTTGHHHLILDGQPVPVGQVVPADEKHIHYGKGQTEAELTLTPGEHTLTMQFADGAHLSFGPELSTTIKVVVQ